MTRQESDTYSRIYEAVLRIPRGRVASYGQIARIAGFPGQARLVGYALHALPDGSEVPWHRVVNARGMLSLRSVSDGGELQRRLLEAEGLEFDAQGRLSLDQFRWRP